MSRRADSWVLALAIALGATVCWLPAWQAAARYHGGYSVAETAAYLLLPALAAVLLAGMAAALGARGRQLLCALLLLTALYLLHKFVRGLLPAAPALPPGRSFSCFAPPVGWRRRGWPTRSGGSWATSSSPPPSCSRSLRMRC
ncbi:hypothetical protein [Chromobacterium subtsugae]|uniref:hypothetical protein n=1 Tax=Chromobacterium subtsugae TaxID=251747 RepID=UPI0007F93E0F|nr:hypothetical protein [Chromobacterium subtsugae]OBU85825.1 hypothetical protein MY55_14670 [Chromobacterium subtsugae]